MKRNVKARQQLVLVKQTLANLSVAQLGDVRGGGCDTSCSQITKHSAQTSGTSGGGGPP